MTDPQISTARYDMLYRISAFIVAVMVIAAFMVMGAKSEPYVRLDAAYSSANKMQGYDLGASPSIEGGFGYRWTGHLRSDLTLGYRNYRLSGAVSGIDATSRVSSLALMANTYFDIGQFGRFTPYIGGGIGASQNSVAQTSLLGGAATINSGSKTSFAWQGSAGVGIALTPSLVMDVGYRYSDLGTARTGDNLSVGPVVLTGAAQAGRLTAHEGRVGIRYSF